jgi:hypothetical protein
LEVIRTGGHPFAVGWYLRFPLSYRDVEELLAERGLLVDHVTVWRSAQRYAPEMERRLRSRLKPTNDSWRVDETYIRIKSKWRYLYRAVGLHRRDPRLSPLGQAGRGRSKKLPGQSIGINRTISPRMSSTPRFSRPSLKLLRCCTETEWATALPRPRAPPRYGLIIKVGA